MTALPKLWVDLLNALAARYPLSTRTAHRLCFAWPAEGPREAQTLQAEALFVHGFYRLALTADICRAEQASPSEALELGAKLISGGILSRDGFISLRHIFTDGRMTEADVHEGIAFLRDTAIEFRHLLLKWDPGHASNASFLLA